MEILYYPGCSEEISASNYDKSARKVCEALAIKVTDVTDWNCCGATNYLSVEEFMGFAVAARNFAIAEKMGFNQMMVVCNGCLTALSKVNQYMEKSSENKNKINEALGAAGLKYEGKIKVRHFIDILANDIGVEKIKQKVIRPLKNLKVAAYSGCQLVRPYCDFDSKEFPTVLDGLLNAAGAEVIDFEGKARCCGGMLMTTKEEVAQKLIKDILEEVTRKGADCIATACPLCQINLEGYQSKINSKYGTNYNMEIVPFTQLLGLALGVGAQELAFNKNLTNTKKVLSGTSG